MNQLDSIEELYDMYSEKKDILRIAELGDVLWYGLRPPVIVSQWLLLMDGYRSME